MKLCDTCTYGDKTEYFKPCVVYSDHCELYERRGSMSVHSTNYDDPEEYERDLKWEYRKEQWEQDHGIINDLPFTYEIEGEEDDE